LEERDLIEKLKKHDEKAFEEFFEYFYGRIYNYVYRRIKMVTIAEDITSETFLRFLKSLPDFELKEGYHIDTWVYSIARNLIRDWFRKNLKYEVLPLEEKFNAVYESILYDPYETYASEEINAVIKKALDMLQPNYKEIITLRFYQKKSTKEIAAILNKSEDAVKVLQFRALKKLKEIVEELLNG